MIFMNIFELSYAKRCGDRASRKNNGYFLISMVQTVGIPSTSETQKGLTTWFRTKIALTLNGSTWVVEPILTYSTCRWIHLRTISPLVVHGIGQAPSDGNHR